MRAHYHRRKLYALACGIAPLAAVSVYSVEGLAGLGGRLLFGVAADRYGAKRVLIVGLLIEAMAIAFSFPRATLQPQLQPFRRRRTPWTLC